MNLFYMNHETQEYIAKHQGAVTIDLEFEPAMGQKLFRLSSRQG